MDPLETLVAKANRDIGTPHQDVPAPGQTTAPPVPRFELYHAAPSLASHKVRFALAEKGLPFRSHALSIIPAGRRHLRRAAPRAPGAPSWRVSRLASVWPMESNARSHDPIAWRAFRMASSPAPSATCSP